jgi:hypothetical protein
VIIWESESYLGDVVVVIVTRPLTVVSKEMEGTPEQRLPPVRLSN